MKAPIWRIVLFALGCIPLLLELGIVVWRVWFLFTTPCESVALGTEVECSDLARSTVFVPAMYGVVLVPPAVFLMLPLLVTWFRHRRASVTRATMP